MMSSAKESAIAIKVDQIDEQFAADAAGSRNSPDANSELVKLGKP